MHCAGRETPGARAYGRTGCVGWSTPAIWRLYEPPQVKDFWRHAAGTNAAGSADHPVEVNNPVRREDDDLHARARTCALIMTISSPMSPATAMVATYAKAQANVSDGGGGGGGGGASRARYAGAQIDGIAPPGTGRPTSPASLNVSSIARYAGAVQRARHERRRCLFCHILI